MRKFLKKSQKCPSKYTNQSINFIITNFYAVTINLKMIIAQSKIIVKLMIFINKEPVLWTRNYIMLAHTLKSTFHS